MATHKTNEFGIEVGDMITFTNIHGDLFRKVIVKVTEKSWFSNNMNRESFGSLEALSKKFADFKITKKSDRTERTLVFCANSYTEAEANKLLNDFIAENWDDPYETLSQQMLEEGFKIY